MVTIVQDPRIELLQGGRRLWPDLRDGLISTATVFVPYGCPDWGESKGERNNLCTFCALPNAVMEYRKMFYGGYPPSISDHISIFQQTLRETMGSDVPHTLMVFNAGSFLAMPSELQLALVQEIIPYLVKRVVVEARASLITPLSLAPLVEILSAHDISLTIRIGVETQDDNLRNKVLKKGHQRRQLEEAVHTIHALGVTAGGYALLNPAPGISLSWAIQEATSTIAWILNEQGADGLGMEEVYFSPACVAPGTLLHKAWLNDGFVPANLWAVLKVLKDTLPCFGGRIHLLPFQDVPPFLAIPSNHVPKGIPESLEGAAECDLEFYNLFERYRETMDPQVLVAPMCSCRPSWF